MMTSVGSQSVAVGSLWSLVVRCRSIDGRRYVRWRAVNCTACGATLAEGVSFCGNCGTANTVVEPRTLIAEAPSTSGPDHAPTRASVVSSGRTFDAKIAPIVVGQRTMLDGAQDAARPEPAPWDTPGHTVRPGSVAPAPSGSGVLRVVASLVGALGVVVAVGFGWVAQNVTDTSEAVRTFAPVGREDVVETSIVDAVIARLVQNEMIDASREEAASAELERYATSDEHAKAWAMALRDAQVTYRDGVGSDGSDVTAIDVTDLVDHLRYTEHAHPNAQLPSMVLVATGDGGVGRTLVAYAALVGLVGGMVAVGFSVVAFVSARGRDRTARMFGFGLILWSVLAAVLVHTLLGVVAGHPVDAALVPAWDAASDRVASALTRDFVIVAGVGLVVVGVSVLVTRRQATRGAGVLPGGGR